MARGRKQKKSESDEPLPVCPIRGCRRRFSKKSNLRTHMKSKHDGIRVHCGKCEETFSAKCSLKRHLINVHHCYSDQPTNNQLDELTVDAELKSTEEALLAKVIRLVRENEEEDETIQELLKKKSILEENYLDLLKTMKK